MIPTVRRTRGNVPAAPSSVPEQRAIPFDYAFRYELTGAPGKVINSVVTVSIESTFTAVSIGYGVVPRVQPIVFGPPPPPLAVGIAGLAVLGIPQRTLATITLGEVFQSLTQNLINTSRTLRRETGPEAVLKNGIKLNPEVAELALQENATVGLTDNVVARLFQVVGSPSELIQFKYAIFDEGSGREFQSEPILNIAGLGSANGERPFRHFATPITFRPRSTIRMEVTEVSDFVGELHVSLHGYKVLGDPSSPTAVTRRRRGRS